MYGRDLGPEGEDFVSEERFDKIRYYLKHGTYPSGADRAEKSRLRSAATHYKLLPDESGQGERLMLKDKEVVSDPQRQYEIAKDTHALQHGGINKTTATIAEKFHWVRIKETVSLVIKNCPDCKESGEKAPRVRSTGDANGTSSLQTRRNGNVNGQPVDPNSMIERLVSFDQMEPNNKNTATSRSPDAAHSTVPIATVQALHQYSGIPLDPQIMGHQASEDYMRKSTNVPSAKTGGASHGPDMALSTGDAGTGVENHPDTRMATERHVSEGDEPMAYQDNQGNVHDTRMQDGVEDSGRRAEDIYLPDID